MKLTTLILFIALVQVSAASIAQRVTYTHKQATLKEVITQIRQQTNYNVLVSLESLSNIPPADVNFRNASISEVLDQLLKNQPYVYEIEDKTILIKEKQVNLIDKTKAFFAQVTVTGKINDETGQPLVGVTVKIKNTNQATTTDQKGNYTITVPDGNTIITFSFIGYETVELQAKDIANGSTITLKPTQTNLKEVVVNKGYYTERQELSTGSTSRVTGKEIAQQPVSDPIMALEGRVAGLYIQQTNGIPGGGSTIRLRGQNSIANGSDPLFVVDGIPFTSVAIANPQFNGGALGQPSDKLVPTPTQNQGLLPGQGQGLSPFNTLNPQDIENIEVLKDADATAIYGSRGANGVILITTKKGKAGATLVDANIYSGIGQVTRQMKLLNTQQYLAMRHQAFKNDGGVPDPNYDYDITGAWDTTRYTDWQKELIGRTSHFTNANLTLSGGNTNTQFLIGGGYSKQTTVFPGNYDDEKATLHMSLNNVSLNGKFRTQVSVQYGNDKSRVPDQDFTSLALGLPPDAPALYDAAGNLNWQNGTWSNPLSTLLINGHSTTANLVGNLNLSYEILPGLTIKGSANYNRIESNQDRQTPGTAFYGPPSAFSRAHLISISYLNTLTFESQINYSRHIGMGKLEALVGITDERDHRNSFGVTGTNYASDAQITNIYAGASIFNGGNYDAQYHYSAIYGRIGYTWEDKYLLNVTGRKDGSSRFGPNNQFGNFGAVGAGWIFSKEKFVSDNFPLLSFGKIRGSYGTSGNDQIENYQYLSTYGFNTINTYQGTNTLSPNAIGNPYFGWN